MPPRGDDRLYEIRRREFMELVGGTLALWSGGCATDVPREIVPYTRQPPEVTPGVPSQYATSIVLDGYAAGVLVTAREGRPIKIEPNAEHPAGPGGTTPQQQAAIWQLYDDWRARRVRRGAEPGTWEDLFSWLRAPRPDRGRGLRVLLEPTASPLVLEQLRKVRARHPEARFAFHSPLRSGADIAGARMAFGRPLSPQYDLSRASVVLVLDADLLNEMPASTRHARQWATQRRPDAGPDGMIRLYAAESRLSATGSVADNRLARPLRVLPDVARALAANLVLPHPLAGAVTGSPDAEVARWARAAAADLTRRPRGSTLVVVGERQPAALHALGYAMNAALGNVGTTLSFIEPLIPLPGRLEGLETLDDMVAEMHAGRVETLVILNANAVYTAPADLGFREALGRVARTLYAGLFDDETGTACQTMAPLAHDLESWGDGRACDGTVSTLQPLIAPLHDARPAAELLAALAGDPAPDARRLLHDLWTRVRGLDQTAFGEMLRVGYRAGSASTPVAVGAPDAPAVAASLRALGGPAAPPSVPGRLDVELYPSPTVHDGRFGNNAWLQELPSAIGKVTWDNPAMLSPATARALGVGDDDVIELAVAGRPAVQAPVLVVPGTADGVAALALGYGRRGQEGIAAGVGFDAYPLRTRAHLHAMPALEARRLGRRHQLARPQTEFAQHGRPVALSRTLADYRREPDFAAAYRGPVASLFPPLAGGGHQWAMSIDLGVCTGCGACVLACMAENNTPVVGRDQVLRGREMHWLRIDSYRPAADAGGARGGNPAAQVHQPMMCQHCERAPCEYVCPVEATLHSPDGLNEMIYNRCVGTRFCSNNCPYKVRRFNWFDWGDRQPANRGTVQLRANPDVTVRERGVMEKCTYCVQRIRGAEIRSRLEDRDIRPGEVVTACQAACPTGAIQFGSLAHAGTEMSRMRDEARAYAVLHAEEGTAPRTRYLARIDNPNPELP
jgi:molybdopterin-containing oxidoreductase family iron-sulfur binding subunit